VTYDVYQRESDNHPDDPNNDPEPLTPESRYEQGRESVESEVGWQAFSALDALRDMIAGLDGEVARLTETVNRLERQIDWNAG
jgi:hypothetical protein